MSDRRARITTEEAAGLVGQIVTLAQDAGLAILDVYNRPAADAHVTWKEDHSPLTDADRTSHDVICAGLERLTPGVAIVSEEGNDRAWPEPGRLHWVVDPLDGTKEFLKRTGEFTVNIALISAGRPVTGVVHAPVLGKTWIGASSGAELIDGSRRQRLAVRAASLHRLCVVASRDHAGPQVKALLQRLPGAVTVSMGSSLKFCLIAEGRADLYLRDGPTSEWDTAAAQAVLEAAGGGVFTLDGRPLVYGKTTLRNPAFVAIGDPDLEWRAVIQEPV